MLPRSKSLIVSRPYSLCASAFLVLTVLTLLLTACKNEEKDDPKTTTDEPIYTVLSEGTLNAGDAIPLPEGSAVLTITGNISHPNQEDSIVMDIATIESVGEVEYTVDDPFEQKSITYRGVVMSDLIAVWGVESSATTATITALNDYQVQVPIKDLLEHPVFFALRADGVYMPVTTRGPAMLVFPYNDVEYDQKHFNDYWVWQIKSIDFQ